MTSFSSKTSKYKLSVSYSAKPVSRFSKVASRFTKKFAAAAVVAGVLLTGIGSAFLVSTSAAPEARADFFSDMFCSKADNPTSGANLGTTAQAGAGQVGLAGALGSVIPIAQPSGGAKTAYEMFSYRPSFDNWIGVYDDGKDSLTFQGSNQVPDAQTSPMLSHNALDCIAFGKNVGTSFAEGLFMGSKALIAVSAELYGWATSASIADPNSQIYPLAEAVESIIVGTPGSPGLKDALYLPFLIPILMIGALIIFRIGIINRSTIGAMQAGLWMLGAAVAGLILINKPLAIAQLSDQIVTAVTTASTSVIIGDPNATALCSLPDGSENKITREVKCGMWYSTVYTPWVVGQYGFAPNDTTPDATAVFTNDPLGSLNNVNITIGSTRFSSGGAMGENRLTWPIYHLYAQGQVANGNVDEARTYSARIAYAQLSGVASNSLPGGVDWEPNTAWGGQGAERQVGMAVLSGVATLGTGLLVLFLSLSLIMYQIMTVVLLVIAPLFLLVGASPGWGKSILMRWFEIIVGLVIKRVLIALLLALFLRFYSIIMVMNIAWLFQLMLIIAVTIVGLTQRKTIISGFTNAINFGGNKNTLSSIGSLDNATDSKAGSLTKNLVNAGIGAAVGGSAAGLAVSAINPSLISGDNKDDTQSKTASGPINGGILAASKSKKSGSEEPGQKVNAPNQKSSTDKKGIDPKKQAAQQLTAQVRRNSVRKAVLDGAKQGFFAGTPQGAAFASASVGHARGDAEYDNKVAELQGNRAAEVAAARAEEAEAKQQAQQEDERKFQSQQAAAARLPVEMLLSKINSPSSWPVKTGEEASSSLPPQQAELPRPAAPQPQQQQETSPKQSDLPRRSLKDLENQQENRRQNITPSTRPFPKKE